MTNDTLVGRALGPYEIESRLGGGGMATVYRGVHRALGLPRAIKVMSSSLSTHDSFVRLFYREAKLATGLRHPNIVQVFDIGDQDGLHYLVMELLEGCSLRDSIRNDGPIPPARVVNLVTQLAEALEHAHGRGVAHRDVKPANAFVSPDDFLTLVDFGIARAADATHLTVTHGIGTPEYMAPEVFEERLNPRDADDHEIGAGIDLYSLGVVAYELVTGRVPFTGRTPQAIAYAHVNRRPQSPSTLRPEVPEEVSAAILRQLAKKPGHRYASPMAFANALREAWGAELEKSPAGDTYLLAAGSRVKLATSAPPERRAVRAAIFKEDTVMGSRPRIGADATVAGAGTSRRAAWRRPLSASAGRTALIAGAFGLAGLLAAPMIGSLTESSRAVVATPTAIARAPEPTATAMPLPTAAPTVAPTAPPTAVPTSVPSIAVLASNPELERQITQVLTDILPLLDPSNPNVDLAVEKLEIVMSQLDPNSTLRPALEDLAVRGLFEEGQRRLNVAFVQKGADQGRESKRILSEAIQHFDRAARFRPNDPTIQQKMAQGHQQAEMATLWVDFDVAYHEGQNDAQISALTQLMAMNPDYSTPEGSARDKLYAAWIAKAVQSWAAQHPDEARAALAEANKVVPGNPKAAELQALWFSPQMAPVRAAVPRPPVGWTPPAQMPPQVDAARGIAPVVNAAPADQSRSSTSGPSFEANQEIR
ncbi:MAG: protein kinase [Chloroflexota bacterium]